MRLPNRQIAVVGQDDDQHRGIQGLQGLQFLHVHLQTAIASETDDPAPPSSHRGPDRGWQVIAHGGGTGIAEQALPRAEMADLKRQNAGGGCRREIDAAGRVDRCWRGR